MAHTFDTSLRIPTTSVNTSNPQSGSYTCGAGATLLVVSLVYAGSTARSGGAPTYNGVALVQADVQRYGSSGPEASVEMWYMLNPPTGVAHTLSVPNAGGLSMATMASSFKAQAGYISALDVSNGNGAVGTNPSVSVTTTTNGDVIVAAIANGAQNWAGTPVGTDVFTNDNGAWGGGLQYLLQATQGTQAMSWTFGTSEDWGMVVAAFKEVPGPQYVSVDGIATAQSFGTPTLDTTSITILDNEGFIHTVGTNAAGRAVSNLSAKENLEFISKFRLGDNTSSASFRVFLRTSGDWADWRTPTSGYEIVINNTGTWQLNRIVSETRTQIATHSWTANTNNNWVHFSVNGSTVSASVWADGGAEPAWQESVTDSNVTGEGNVQLGYFGDSGIHNLYLDQITIQEVLSSTPLIRPTGIESGEAIGTAAIVRGSVSIVTTGIDSLEQFGTISVGQGIVPSGIQSSETFGTANVIPQAVPVVVTGTSSEEQFGLNTLQVGSVTIVANGVTSSESFGTSTLARGSVTLVTTGVLSGEVIGVAQINRGSVSVEVTGTPTEETFGEATILQAVNISPSSISSEEAFGVAQTIRGEVQVSPIGINGSEAFGSTTVLPPTARVYPEGIASSEMLLTYTLIPGSINVQVNNIPSLEQVGSPALQIGSVTVAPVSIPSSEQFGNASLAGVSSLQGIPSDEAFGIPTLVVGSVSLQPAGISSEEQFGNANVQQNGLVVVEGIAGQEAFGGVSILVGTVSSQIEGISSSEQFGAPTLLVGVVYISVPGIAGAEEFGGALILPGTVTAVPAGVLSDELFGAPTFIPGEISFEVLGIESQQLIGTPQVRIFPFADDFTQDNYTPWNTSKWVVEVVS